MSDKRTSERLLHRDEVSFELMTEYGQVVQCETVDVSSTGIKLRVDKALPTRSIQKLCIESGQLAKRLVLIAEVKWVEQESSSGFLIGLEVQPAQGYDHQVWMALWQPSTSAN